MHPDRVLTWLASGFRARWQTILLVAAVNSAIAGLSAIDESRPFWHPFVSVQCMGFSIAYFVNLVTPWQRRRPLLMLVVAVCLGAVLGTILIIVVKQYSMEDLVAHPLRFLYTTMGGLFLGLLVSFFFYHQWREAMNKEALHRAEAEQLLLRQQAAEAQLKLMQAQIEPHFLFNTLSGVQFLIESNPSAAGRMLDHLIQYLRAAIPQLRQASTTLGQEIRLAQAYLSILHMRMGKRLSFHIDFPAALEAHPFPPMMLLSLVENAVKHGIEPLAEGGEIAIQVEVVDNKLRVSVRDSGRGLPEKTTDGVGLSNIRDRLLALYGNAGRIDLEQSPLQGVEARITLPYAFN